MTISRAGLPFHPIHFSLDLPAEPLSLDLARACLGILLESVSEPENSAATIYNLQLALHEIMVNIMEHAYANQPGRRIEVKLSLTSNPCRLIIELQDTGAAFDIDQVSEPDLEQPHDGGYGLFLVRALTDELVYQPQTDKNVWRLIKNLP